MRKLDRLRKELNKGKPLTYPTRPMFDGSDRVWTDFDHWWFNRWFLNEMAWQPTLFKKIKRWLELEYQFFSRKFRGPKCPTPISTILWNIEYKFPNVNWKETIKQRRPVKWPLYGEY